MAFREIRHRLIQSIAWGPMGAPLLRAWLALRRRVDATMLNYSLHTPTNGELWLIGQLPPNPTIADVGYNAGDYTTDVLAQRPGARVFAFDPSRSALTNFQTAHGSDDRVSFANIALSNTVGQAEFHDYGNMSSSLVVRHSQATTASTAYIVPVSRLDAFMAEKGVQHIDLLKIDAEGFDLHVIEGAAGLLASNAIDVVMFEYADGWISSRRFLQEACAFLEGHNYQMFRLYNGFLTPFTYETRHENFSLGCMFVGLATHHRMQGLNKVRSVIF